LARAASCPGTGRLSVAHRGRPPPPPPLLPPPADALASLADTGRRLTRYGSYRVGLRGADTGRRLTRYGSYRVGLRGADTGRWLARYGSYTDPSKDGLNLGASVYDAATKTAHVLVNECANNFGSPPCGPQLDARLNVLGARAGGASMATSHPPAHHDSGFILVGSSLGTLFRLIVFTSIVNSPIDTPSIGTPSL
jgi:hypothetical protein